MYNFSFFTLNPYKLQVLIVTICDIDLYLLRSQDDQHSSFLSTSTYLADF